MVDDTKLSGVAYMLEERDAIHWDLDRPQEWASVKVMKFNKAKLPPGSGQSSVSIQAGG